MSQADVSYEIDSFSPEGILSDGAGNKAIPERQQLRALGCVFWPGEQS